MSYAHRRHSDSRAESPPIDWIPPPSHRRSTQHRSDSPPVLSPVPSPPRLVRSRTTIIQPRPKPSLKEKVYNAFRPRSREIEVVTATPVRVSRPVRIERSDPVPREIRRTYSVRRTTEEPPPPPPAPAPLRPSHREVRIHRTRSHGMSPRIPGNTYVPLPDRQPPLETSNSPGGGTSEHEDGSQSPRRRTYVRRSGYHAGPFDPPRDRVEEPVTINNEPVRANPQRNETNLSRQVEHYRDEAKRVSRELDSEKVKNREQAVEIEQLRRRLRETEEYAMRVAAERNEIQDSQSRERINAERRANELARVQQAGGLVGGRGVPRRTVIVDDRDDPGVIQRLPQREPYNPDTGDDALRQAQDHVRRGTRGGSRRYSGFR